MGQRIWLRAAKSLTRWASELIGVQRFVAETQRENLENGTILGKLGVQQRDGNEYWKDPLEFEWERKVVVHR
jgi:hypothetical protein